MAKALKTTSPEVASKAAAILGDETASADVKSVAASALAQTEPDPMPDVSTGEMFELVRGAGLGAKAIVGVDQVKALVAEVVGKEGAKLADLLPDRKRMAEFIEKANELARPTSPDTASVLAAMEGVDLASLGPLPEGIKLQIRTGPPFEPTDQQIAWAMNIVGPVRVSVPAADGMTYSRKLEDALPTALFAMVVRTIVSAAQKTGLEDKEYYGADTPLIREIAGTKGLELFK